VLVAELNGRIAGFMALRENDAYVHLLYVSPDAQRSGIGARLLGEAMQRRAYWRPAIDAYRISLEIAEASAVRATYEKLRAEHGFRMTDYKTETEALRPRVCAVFSENLSRADIDFAKFVSVDGKDPETVTAEGSQLCIEGLSFGQRYEIQIRDGLPSETKEVIESVLAECRSAYGLRVTTLRYFNAAGADPDGEVGEDHDPETHLIPLAIAAALGGKGLEIYGTDYPTPDGTAIRDYIHVQDLADAHVAALARLRDGATSLLVNLGTGRGHSVREVIAAAERVTGRRIPVREAARRPGDPPVLVADATRARALLGFAPRFTELAPIVETAWRWTNR